MYISKIQIKVFQEKTFTYQFSLNESCKPLNLQEYINKYKLRWRNFIKKKIQNH